MSKEKIYCPLISAADKVQPCIEHKCGWYSVIHNECGICAIADALVPLNNMDWELTDRIKTKLDGDI